MGFLHKLWDETLAGPAPESGLGKLRKYDSFHARSSPPLADAVIPNSNNVGGVSITRSITIIRTTNTNLKNISVDPESPAGSSTPGTPFTR